MTLEPFELRIPAEGDDVARTALADYLDVSNADSREFWGSTDFDTTEQEMLASLADTEYQIAHRYLWREDGVPVAKAVIWKERLEDAKAVTAVVTVHPEHRGRGIGRHIADHIEAKARELGAPTLQTWIDHRPATDGGVQAVSGFGAVAEDPSARFALARGFVLEQVERVSRLDVVAARGSLQRHLDESQAKAGPDYALRQFIGRTPPDLLDSLAALHARMSTDAPSAGMDTDEQVWDAERLERADARSEASGLVELVTVAIHVPTETAVAYTTLVVPKDPDAQVYQDDTLVHADHRGHRLGMLVKAANLLQLGEYAPDRSTIVTWNAEENAPMLNVNVALGFEPLAAEGGWQRSMPPAPDGS